MNPPRSAPYSLGLRLSWLFAGLTLVGFGFLSAAIYVVAMINLSSRADAELDRKADLVKRLVAEAASSGDIPSMRHKLNEFFVGHEDLQVTLTNRSGEISFQSAGRVASDAPHSAKQIQLPQNLLTLDIVSATIVMDRSSDARLLAGLAVLLVASTVLGAAAVSASGFLLVRYSLAPLRGLADQTRALSIGQLGGGRLYLDRPVKELEPWIEQFNALMARLDYAYRQLEAFNADVAHELRTPLATLMGQTEVQLSRPRSVSELRETLGSNLEELQRLSLIVNDMLFLARADRGARATPRPHAPLSQTAAEVLEYYDGMMAEKGVSARIVGEAHASFEAGLVRRSISNLVSNAIRYAYFGSTITVELSERSAAAWITVTNAGQGIAASDIPYIFDRFYRVQRSRQGSSANHGLGLAIVSAIAKMHGGATCAASSQGSTSIGFSLARTEVNLKLEGHST